MSWGRGARDHRWVGSRGGLSEPLELEEAKLHSYPQPLTTETAATTRPDALPSPPTPPQEWSPGESRLLGPPTAHCPLPRAQTGRLGTVWTRRVAARVPERSENS